jgi:hypothetical protein
LEIEGVPPHVWREDIMAKMLSPTCWIQSVEPATAVSDDLSSYRLTAWAKNPSAIPKVIRLGVTEPETVASSGGGGQFAGAQPFLRKKKLLTYTCLVHLRCVYGYSP